MMKKSFASGFFALAALVFAGPAATLPSERTPTVPAGADPRLMSAIKKANTDFEVAMTKADTATIAEPYTPDAVFVSPDGTATKGRVRIEQLYRDRFAKSGPALEARVESEELMLGGNLAYERGRGALTRFENGKRVSDWARFLTIWQRQADGDWKIFRNVVLPGQ
jgi:uncharacterized protein (TIGR02246 family)